MRTKVLAVALVGAAAAAGAALSASALRAQSSEGAIENAVPGIVKLLHTGGSLPNGQYADLGRLTLPAGSWAVSAHTTIRSQGPGTGVDCFLDAPNVPMDHQQLEITNTKNENIKQMVFGLVTNAPNGGNVDLFCKVSNAAADRHVFGEHTALIAINVNGTTFSRNDAPALGTY